MPLKFIREFFHSDIYFRLVARETHWYNAKRRHDEQVWPRIQCIFTFLMQISISCCRMHFFRKLIFFASKKSEKEMIPHRERINCNRLLRYFFSRGIVRVHRSGSGASIFFKISSFASVEVGIHRKFNLLKYVRISSSSRVKERQHFKVIITFHIFSIWPTLATSHTILHVRADYLIWPEVDKSFVQTTNYTLHARYETEWKSSSCTFPPSPHIITQIN